MEVDSVLTVGETIVDFNTLATRVETIQRLSGAIFSIRDSQTVNRVNKLSAASSKQRFEPLDERFKYKYVKWGCKQSGKIRTTGKGERPHQR
jgi:hypothetical protein